MTLHKIKRKYQKWLINKIRARRSRQFRQMFIDQMFVPIEDTLIYKVGKQVDDGR